MAKNPAETPMMKQFYDIKRMHPDAILLFRCGDFYETYADDAVRASEVLGITLTRRSSATPGSVAMAGFPTTPSTTTCPSWCGQACAWPFATSWRTRSWPRNW